MIGIDLHIHSKHSNDSVLSPRAIIRKAKSEGLSAIAVIDHSSVSGARETLREASGDDILVVLGTEIRTNGFGDVVGLFVDKRVASTDIYGAIDEIRDQDGLVVLPHPLRGHLVVSREIMDRIDVVEALNGRTTRSKNIGARQLAFSHGKPMLSGSNAHFSFEIGCVGTILSGTFSSLEELRKSIIKNDRMLVGRESTQFVHVLSFGVKMVGRAKYLHVLRLGVLRKGRSNIATLSLAIKLSKKRAK
jgi:predicted metal-dependent phosphoesterase TrpH